jgi:hypothetical protein
VYANFATEYQDLPDDDLLRIAAEGDLVEEAKIALQAEMSRRKLTKDAVTKYQVDEQRQAEQNRKETGAKTANFFGYGFEFFGRAYLSEEDRSHGIQVRTKWFSIRHTPIFPIASYRCQCKERNLGKAHVEQEKLLNQVPLNWKQVIATYAKTIGIVILTIVAIVAWNAFRKWLHR